MQVLRDAAQGTVTIVPTADRERASLECIRALGPGAVMGYHGCRGRGSADPSYTLSFEVGDLHVEVCGDGEEDRRILGGIRDTCYFATAGLTYRGTVEINDTIGYQFTGARCQHCDHPMITRSECEWKTCDACAARCDHAYECGIIHGGGIEVGVGSFCERCGRSKPGESYLPLELHHANTVAYLWRQGANLTILPPLHVP